MCFYAYILARETKLTIRWTDIIELSKTNSLLVADSIRVVTRDNKEVYVKTYLLIYLDITFLSTLFFILLSHDSCSNYLLLMFEFYLLQHYFSMFLHKSDTYSLMEQLTNIAMKRYFDYSRI